MVKGHLPTPPVADTRNDGNTCRDESPPFHECAKGSRVASSRPTTRATSKFPSTDDVGTVNFGIDDLPFMSVREVKGELRRRNLSSSILKEEFTTRFHQAMAVTLAHEARTSRRGFGGV